MTGRAFIVSAPRSGAGKTVITLALLAALNRRGIAGHDPAVQIAGIILNRVGSERHRTLVSEAIAAMTGSVPIAILGAVPRDEMLALPERHLGLVQAGEHPDLALRLDRLAGLAEQHLDLDCGMALAASVPP